MVKTGSGRLELHIPTLPEFWYRQSLMSDPDTMSYNRGYDLDFQGYHRDTGCIDFPESEWADTYRILVGREPQQWYAYLARVEDGAFVGEVNVHRPGEESPYDMGIVIEGRHRGQGYGSEGLGLLLEYAFQVLDVPALRNTFEDTRDAGMRIHFAAGFRDVGRESGIIELRLTREEYLKQRGL